MFVAVATSGAGYCFYTFARFKDRGWKKVGLGVDASNATGAVRLYEKVGMHATRRFDAYQKEVAL